MHVSIKSLSNDQKRLLVARLLPISIYLDCASRMIRCPFHQDDTPSAKLYEDEDGVERLFCFGCNRQWTSWDYLAKIKEVDPLKELLAKFRGEELSLAVAQVKRAKPRVEKDFKVFSDTFKEGGDLEKYLTGLYQTISL